MTETGLPLSSEPLGGNALKGDSSRGERRLFAGEPLKPAYDRIAIEWIEFDQTRNAPGLLRRDQRCP